MHITDTEEHQVQFWGFPFLTHITFIKNPGNFEKLPNGLGDIRCLLYAQHVNLPVDQRLDSNQNHKISQYLLQLN